MQSRQLSPAVLVSVLEASHRLELQQGDVHTLIAGVVGRVPRVKSEVSVSSSTWHTPPPTLDAAMLRECSGHAVRRRGGISKAWKTPPNLDRYSSERTALLTIAPGSSSTLLSECAPTTTRSTDTSGEVVQCAAVTTQRLFGPTIQSVARELHMIRRALSQGQAECHNKGGPLLSSLLTRVPLQKWTQPRLVLQSWRDASQGNWRTWSAEPFTIIGRGSRMSASGIAPSWPTYPDVSGIPSSHKS